MLLEINDLSVQYAGSPKKALDSLSFFLQEKEMLGVVGESGSGKSTLANALLSLLPFDAAINGNIRFDQKDISNLNESDMVDLRGSSIGLIFQEPASIFNPVFRIRFQFEEMLSVKLKMKDSRKRYELMDESLAQVHIKEKDRILESYPHQLSGGQLQRIAIAFALSLKPRVLIADEPTSSLDVTTESQIINLLKEVNLALGISIIFISHNLDLIKAICSRVLVLFEGRLVEAGQTRTVFSAATAAYTQSLLRAHKGFDE